MAILSRAATFTIGDAPLHDTAAIESADSRQREGAESAVDSPPTNVHESRAPRLDPAGTRELLLEARDRARTSRRKPSGLRREDGASWSPPTLVAAGALVLAGLIAGTLGARLARSHSAPRTQSATHAEHGRSRPHDRRVRPHRPHPRWRLDRAPAPAVTARPVTAPSATAARPTPTAETRMPVSPTPSPTRPVPPAQPGGEFVLGGP